METNAVLQQANQAMHEGDLSTARRLLAGALRIDINNPALWLAMAEVVEQPQQASDCLKRVLALDPGNAEARLKLDRLTAPPAPPDPDQTLKNFFAPALPVAAQNPDPLPETPGPGTISPPAQLTSEPPVQDNGIPGVVQRDGRLQKDIWEQKKPKRAASCLTSCMVVATILIVISVVGGYIWLRTMPSNQIYTILNQLATFGSAGNNPAESEAVKNAVYENIRASNDRDVEGYMATIHSQSPAYATTRATIITLFQTYRLSYSLDDLKVVSITGDQAFVTFKLTTIAIDGSAFRDNTITGEWIMRKEDSVWKIYNQAVFGIDYLAK